MTDFFEPPQPPEMPAPEPRYRTPEWLGPPEWILPGIVPLSLVVARTETVAVCLTRIAAYPAGFEFTIHTMSNDDEDGMGDPLMFDQFRIRAHAKAGELPPELLRFGLQFADGTKVTNLDDGAGYGYMMHTPPDGPVMHGGGGGGGGRNWTQSQWVWPLPPAGPITVVVEWPAQGIPLTRTELDAGVVREAAARSQVVFSDEHLPSYPDDDDDDRVVQFIR